MTAVSSIKNQPSGQAVDVLRDGKRIMLRDGRSLGFQDYGAAGGLPVFAFHGTPGSRSMFAPGDHGAAQLDIRLIAPERPGYGLSSVREGYRLSDWPADVAELADALAIDKFAVAGVSGGGPFATACAALLPERVLALGLVSPMGPVRPPEGAPVIGSSHHVLFRLLSQIPAITNAGAAAGRLMFENAPDLAQKGLMNRVGPQDRAILSRPEVWAAVLKTLSEGLRNGGRGVMQDLRIFGERWDIPFAAIRCPATLWQGDADTNVPIEAARHLSSLIPRCDFIELSGQGHYWIIDHLEEVLANVRDGFFRNREHERPPATA